MVMVAVVVGCGVFEQGGFLIATNHQCMLWHMQVEVSAQMVKQQIEFGMIRPHDWIGLRLFFVSFCFLNSLVG